MQARVQDIEAHNKEQAAQKIPALPEAPSGSKVASKPAYAHPAGISTLFSRQEPGIPQPAGTPVNTLNSDSAQPQMGSTPANTLNSDHAQPQMGSTPANTLNSDSAQPQMRQLPGINWPVQRMTDDTARIESGSSLADSMAQAPTPMGTMNTNEAGDAPAAALQAAARKLNSQEDPWGIFGLTSAPKLANDPRMKPSQLTDTIDSLNEAKDPSAMSTSLADTAYDLAERLPMGVSLADTHEGPSTPAGTLSDSNANARGPHGSDFEGYDTAEGPGVRFKEGADSVISNGMRAAYENEATRASGRHAATGHAQQSQPRESDDYEATRVPGMRAATGYAAQSPRQSAAWQNEMGSVAGWQALASDVRLPMHLHQCIESYCIIPCPHQ